MLQRFNMQIDRVRHNHETSFLSELMHPRSGRQSDEAVALQVLRGGK